MPKWLDKLETKKPFTPQEAWKVFRVAAIGESLGWSLLIAGLIDRYYDLPGNTIAIPIAGQIHGMIFVSYFITLILLYPSLQWTRTRSLIALLSGIPPYGSLLFEIVENRKRIALIKNQISVSVLVQRDNQLLAAQPSHGVEWTLPTWIIDSPENRSHKLLTSLIKVFGNEVKGCSLKLIKVTEQNNYLYLLGNSSRITNINLIEAAEAIPFVDELAFVDKKQAPDLFTSLTDNSFYLR